MQSGTGLILHGFQIPLALPSRTLGGSKFVNRFGRGVERARSARPPPARWLEDELCPNEINRNENALETGEAQRASPS